MYKVNEDGFDRPFESKRSRVDLPSVVFLLLRPQKSSTNQMLAPISCAANISSIWARAHGPWKQLLAKSKNINWDQEHNETASLNISVTYLCAHVSLCPRLYIYMPKKVVFCAHVSLCPRVYMPKKVVFCAHVSLCPRPFMPKKVVFCAHVSLCPRLFVPTSLYAQTYASGSFG